MSDQSHELFSPFKLHVTVKRAQHIVVADIVSSDPYIVVQVGDVTLGSTDVVKSTLSPVWDEHFEIPLLHLGSTLTLKLYDHNDFKKDEFLGQVTVRVDSFDQINKEFVVSVEQGDSTYKPCGEIIFGAFVEVHQTLVTVQKRPEDVEAELAAAEEAAKPSPSPVRGNLARTSKRTRHGGKEDEVNDLLTETLSSDPVGYALKETMLLKDEDLYDKYLIEDLLRDIRAIDRHAAWALKAASDSQQRKNALKGPTKSLLEIELEATPMQFVYNNMLAGKGSSQLQHPLSSTKFDMLLLNKSNRTTDMLIPGYNVNYTSPMLYHGLQLEFYRKGRKNEIVIIYTSSVHMTWVFVRHLRAFMSWWKYHKTTGARDSTEDSPSDFTCPVSIEIEGENVRSVGGNQQQEVAMVGLAVLSITRRYELIIQNKETRDPKFTMSLDDLVGITINADAPLCEEIAAVVEVIHANPTGDEHNNVEEVVENNWTPGKFLLRGGDHLLKSGVNGLRSIKRGGEGLAGAMNDLAHGHVGKVISSTQAKTEAALAGVGNLIPGLVADKMHYVIVKDRNGSLTTEAKELPVYNESFAVPLHSLADKDSKSHGMNVFLMQNKGNAHSLVGEVFISYKHMIGSGHEKDLNKQVKDGESFISDYPLNTQQNYTVVVENATDLATASPLFDKASSNSAAASSSGNREFYIKCRFAKWNGVNVGKAFKEVRTKSVKSSNNCPDWGGAELTLSAKDGLFLAEYVRLEIFVGSVVNGTRIGSIFLPISEFLMNSATAQVSSFPVSYFKKLPLGFTRDGLGSLRLKFYKHSDNSNCMATVRLRTTLRHCNEYCSFWSSDCILAGSILQDYEAAKDKAGKVDSSDTKPKSSGCHVEHYAAAPGYEGLILVNTLGGNDGSKSTVDANGLLTGLTVATETLLLEGAKNVVQLFDQDLPDPDGGYPITMIFPCTVTDQNSPDYGAVRLEVFEYDNRSILPPYGWITLEPNGFEYKNDAYRRYKDEKYKQKAPFTVLEEAEPPVGYEWSSSWKYDSTYTKTDENGWAYGITIGSIRSNLKNNTPNTSMAGVCVRRKKWVRTAVPIRTAGGVGDDSKSTRQRSKSAAPPPLPIRRDLKPLLPEGTVLGLCEERGNTLATMNSVLVPWNQVAAVTVITPSVLSIVCEVNKYNRDRPMSAAEIAASAGHGPGAVGGLSGNEEFQKVNIEIFVWGCPAEKLRSLIQERQELVSIRESIIDITAAGSMQMSKALEATPLIADHDRKPNSSADKIAKAVAVVRTGGSHPVVEGEDNDDDAIPETVELSYGATVVMELDEVLDQLEARALELNEICDRLQAATPSSGPMRGYRITPSAMSNKARSGSSKIANVVRVPSPVTTSFQGFSVGRLLFRTISCTNLKNVETMGGANDVYVNLGLGSWAAKTGAIDEAGSEAHFDYLNFSVENVTAKQLIRNQLTVQVFDENKVAADVLIGQATISVAEVLNCVGDWVEFKSELLNRRNKVAGSITLSIKVQDALCSGQEGEADEASVAATLLSSMELERMIILRRIARVQLYIASLLGVGLEGDHDFSASQITKLILSDLDQADKIEQADPVSTASNRIQFLMDMAELRIRDAALRGWTQREGGVFESTMTTLLNSYYIAMVSLLGKFFDNKGVGISAVQGVQSKIKLIRFFMQNDGRLNYLMVRVLRPYQLKLSMPPRFSMCLNFDQLLDWYNFTLQTEMKVYVDNAMLVWTDPAKNPNRQLSKSSKLPWVPQKPLVGLGRDNQYNTSIPEDVKSCLDVYLTVALIKAKDLDMFHSTKELRIVYASKIRRVNALVRYAFTNSFSYVCSAYMQAVKSTDWTCNVANRSCSWKADFLPEDLENSLYDHMTFLASVANDAARVCSTGILGVSVDASSSGQNTANASKDLDVIKAEQMAADAMTKAFAEFEAVRASALDNLACVAFSFVISHFIKDEQNHEVEFEDKWIKACETNVNAQLAHEYDPKVDVTDISPLCTAAEELAAQLPGYENILSFDCYSEFLMICADKFVICVLFLLQRANQRYSLRMSVNNIYLKQLVSDIACIQHCIRTAANALPDKVPMSSKYYNSYATLSTDAFVAEVIMTRLERLTSVKFILQSNPHQEEFYLFNQEVFREAKNHLENHVRVEGIDTIGQDRVNQDVFLAYFLRTVSELRNNKPQKRLMVKKCRSGHGTPSSSGKTTSSNSGNAGESQRKRGSVTGFFSSVFRHDDPPKHQEANVVSPGTLVRQMGDNDNFSDDEDGNQDEDDDGVEDDECAVNSEVGKDEEMACLTFTMMVETIIGKHTDKYHEDLSEPIPVSDSLSLFHYSPVRRIFDDISSIQSEQSLSRVQSESDLESKAKIKSPMKKHKHRHVFMQSLPLSAHLLQSSMPFEQLQCLNNNKNSSSVDYFDGSRVKSLARGTVNVASSAASMTVSGTKSVAMGTVTVAKGTAHTISGWFKREPTTPDQKSVQAAAPTETQPLPRQAPPPTHGHTEEALAHKAATFSEDTDTDEEEEIAEEEYQDMISLAESIEQDSNTEDDVVNKDEILSSPSKSSRSPSPSSLGNAFSNLLGSIGGGTKHTPAPTTAPATAIVADVMKEIEVSDISVSHLFSYHKDDVIDTFLTLSVENRDSSSFSFAALTSSSSADKSKLRTSDLNNSKSTRKTVSVYNSANPKFSKDVFYFTIPTDTLDPALASNKGNPTNLIVKLTLIGKIINTHVGTVTIALDKLFNVCDDKRRSSGGHTVSIDDEYDIQWVDQQLRTLSESKARRKAKIHMTLKLS